MMVGFKLLDAEQDIQQRLMDLNFELRKINKKISNIEVDVNTTFRVTISIDTDEGENNVGNP